MRRVTPTLITTCRRLHPPPPRVRLRDIRTADAGENSRASDNRNGVWSLFGRGDKKSKSKTVRDRDRLSFYRIRNVELLPIGKFTGPRNSTRVCRSRRRGEYSYFLGTRTYVSTPPSSSRSRRYIGRRVLVTINRVGLIIVFRAYTNRARCRRRVFASL